MTPEDYPFNYCGEGRTQVPVAVPCRGRDFLTVDAKYGIYIYLIRYSQSLVLRVR